MFSDIVPSEELKSAFSQAAIVAADIDLEARAIHAAIRADAYIPKRLVDQLQKQIVDFYGLARAELTTLHPSTELCKLEPDELMHLFVSRDSMARGALAGAQWEWEGSHLHVKLRANGKDALQKLSTQVCRELSERFGAQVTISIEAGSAAEGQALFDEMQTMRDAVMEQLPAVRVRQPERVEKTTQNAETIYGKPFRGTPVPMNTLNMDMGTIIVEGRVFAVDHKELTKRGAWVLKFDITDNTNSIRVSRFLETKEARPILEHVQPGAVLAVQGTLVEDRFENEMVLKPYAIMPGSLPKRKDLAPGEKRV